MCTVLDVPKGYGLIGEGCAGKAYGHVPGHQFHDVEVAVALRASDGRFRAAARETLGCSQGRGRDQTNECRDVVGFGDTLAEALAQVQDRASSAGFNTEYLVRAVCRAQDEAENAVYAKAKSLRQ